MEEQMDNTAPEQKKYESLKLYEGTAYKTMLSKKYKQRKAYAPYDPSIIKSFIPGTIRKIYVEEGQKVKKGENLLILEAMKMLNELLSPMDGVVKRLHVKVDDVVANKQVLIELEKAKRAPRKKKEQK
jgi:biotin carboxyl carrier protein